MRRGTASIENRSVPDGGEASFPACASGSERLASLAALTLSRQTPGLVLPPLSQIPASYTLTAGGDLAIGLGLRCTTPASLSIATTAAINSRRVPVWKWSST